VLDAARDVLSVRGFNAEVAEIAEVAGVGVGTIYRHFPNRHELISAVILEMGESFGRDVSRHLANPSVIEALRGIIHSAFDIADRYGKLFLDQIAGSGSEAYESAFDREQARIDLRELFRRGSTSGELPADLDAELCLGMLLGIFAPRAMEFLIGDRGASEVAPSAFEFFLAGVLHTNGATPE
jgi:AcrR family transcriptional regulator